MGKRTKSRECALQILYNIDIASGQPSQVLASYWDNHSKLLAFREFADKLVEGVCAKKTQIDKTINGYAENWKIERMAVVDRNVLRISAFELLFLDDIPPKVSINEAVNLAKKFSTSDSGKFVNGILDRINKEKKR